VYACEGRVDDHPRSLSLTHTHTRTHTHTHTHTHTPNAPLGPPETSATHLKTEKEWGLEKVQTQVKEAGLPYRGQEVTLLCFVSVLCACFYLVSLSVCLEQDRSSIFVLRRWMVSFTAAPFLHRLTERRLFFRMKHTHIHSSVRRDLSVYSNLQSTICTERSDGRTNGQPTPIKNLKSHRAVLV